MASEEVEAPKGYQAGAGINPNNATAFGGSIPANAPNMEIMALDKMLETAGQLGNEFLLSEVRRWNMRIQRYQDDNQNLVEKNAKLAEDVEKARMDKLDIIEYLREEEAKKKFQLTELQRTLKETTDEKDGRIQQLEEELAATKESSNEKIEALTEQIAAVERQLDTLKHFEQQKAKMDAKLKTLNEQIMREQIQHRESIRNLERQWQIERDRRDKEEKRAIAKAKLAILQMQDQHISNVTRRALDDNNQLQLEIAFQTKQTKDLLEQNGTYTRSAIQLRRELEVQQDAEKALAQKNCSYQKTIKALLAKMKQLEAENAQLRADVDAVGLPGGGLPMPRAQSTVSENSNPYSDANLAEMERAELESKLTNLKREARSSRAQVKRLQGKLKTVEAVMDEAAKFVVQQGGSSRPPSKSGGTSTSLPAVRGSTPSDNLGDYATKLYIKMRSAME